MSLNLLRLDWRRSDLPKIVVEEVKMYWLSDAAKANGSKRDWKAVEDEMTVEIMVLTAFGFVIEFLSHRKVSLGITSCIFGQSQRPARRFKSCREPDPIP
jgi:hypothetical protein